MKRIAASMAALATIVCAATCSESLAPTGDVAVLISERSPWPRTLAVAELATIAASVNDDAGHSVLGVDLTWETSDSTILTVARVANGGPGAAELAAGLSAVVSSHGPGEAELIARIARAGFAPTELRVPVVVSPRGEDTLVTVSLFDTLRIDLEHADTAVWHGATVTWQTSDPSIVKVLAVACADFCARLAPYKSGAAQITATVNGGRVGRRVFQLPVNVAALRVSESPPWKHLLSVGETAQLGLEVRDAHDRVVTTPHIDWRSTNSAVDVDAFGRVTAQRVGGAEIIANVGDPEFTTTEYRNVVNVGGLNVTRQGVWPARLTVTDTSNAFRVSVTDAQGQPIANPNVVWSSTNPAMLTVDAATGRVIAFNEGGAEVVASVGVPGFPPTELHQPVAVVPLRVVPVQKWPDTLTVTDTSSGFGVVVLDANNNPRSVPVRWSSTNTFAFTADAATGRAIALNQGGGQMVASIGAAPFQVSELRASVAVLPLQIVELPSAWPSYVNLTNDTTVRVVVRDAFGKVRSGVTLEWRSTNTSVFGVSPTGTVTPRRVGEAELVVTAGAAPFQVAEHRAALQVHLKWRSINGGWTHTCGLSVTEPAGYCWGSNRFGELGTGSPLGSVSLLPRAIASVLQFEELEAGGDSLRIAGAFGPHGPEAHSCGRLGNTVQCWGAAFSSQIGDGVEACQVAFGTVTSCTRTQPVTIIDNAQFGTTTNANVFRVTAGGRSSCAVLRIGIVGDPYLTCWGLQEARSGPGFPPPPQLPGFGVAPAASGFFAPPAGNAATMVIAGGAHVCRATELIGFNGIICFGNNDFGQAGGTDAHILDIQGHAVFIPQLADPAFASAGSRHSCVIDFGVLCWGSNFHGQLGAPTPVDPACGADFCSRALAVSLPEGAIAVSAGGEHTCVIGTSGNAYCWGSNQFGQLGGTSVGGPTPVLVSGGLHFAKINAGFDHTCGLTPDGSAYCWGRNDQGQLGDGTRINRSTPVRVSDPQ